MTEMLIRNLQLFGEGGDGAPAGEGVEGAVAGEAEDSALSRIPERARANYKKALEINKQTETVASEPTPTADEAKPRLSYQDLIKSEEYKDEHKAYMDKTISERLKKYKGIEESNKKMADALNVVANKYGLDVGAEDFLDSLSKKISEDDSYYEEYAMEHDIGIDEAKEILTLKQEVANQKAKERIEEQAKAELEKEQARQEQWRLLNESAMRTQSVYPSFNLETEMQNEKFMHICAVTNGDTLAAYRAVHHDELMQAQGLAISQQASLQMANAVAANKARPIENGLSSQASTVTQTDWSKATLAELRSQAEAWRRGK